MKKIINLITLGFALSVLTGCGEQKPVHYHNYDSWTYVDENTHQKTCPTCDENTKNHVLTGEHHWGEGVILSPATHIENGLKMYTCQDCYGIKEETISKLADHVFDQQIVGAKYLNQAAGCVTKATYFYSCICGEKGTESFEYGNPVGHDVKTLTINHSPNKTSYKSYDLFDTTGLEVSVTCNKCDGGVVDNSLLTFEYEHGDSFRVGDTQVTVHYGNTEFNISGLTVSKANATITGVKDVTIGCGESARLDRISSIYGDVSIEIKDKDNQVLSAADYDDLNAEYSPYTLTARVEETSEFIEAVETSTITVRHVYSYDVSKSADVCGCGICALEDALYDLKDGVFYVEDAKGGIASLITSETPVYDRSTQELARWSNYVAGNEIACYVVIDSIAYNFSVKIATNVITSLPEMYDSVTVKNYIAPILGYYTLGKDIDGEGYVYSAPYFSWDSTYARNSFNAEFDGRGHTISNFTITGKGIFGVCGYGAVIKNLNLTHLSSGDNSGAACLTYYAYHSFLTNIHMQFDSYATLTKGSQLYGCGNLIGLRAEGAKTANQDVANYITNCEVDATGLNIGAAVVGWGENSAIYNKFVVKCASYTAYGFDYGATGSLGGFNTPITVLPDGIQIVIG